MKKKVILKFHVIQWWSWHARTQSVLNAFIHLFWHFVITVVCPCIVVVAVLLPSRYGMYTQCHICARALKSNTHHLCVTYVCMWMLTVESERKRKRKKKKIRVKKRLTKAEILFEKQKHFVNKSGNFIEVAWHFGRNVKFSDIVEFVRKTIDLNVKTKREN